MGFSEDDRIRAKNKKHQVAYEIYEGLVTAGFSPNDIVQHAELAMQNTQDSFRYEVYNTIISIVKGVINEKGSTN